jgi:hypothetical protein
MYEAAWFLIGFLFGIGAIIAFITRTPSSFGK